MQILIVGKGGLVQGSKYQFGRWHSVQHLTIAMRPIKLARFASTEQASGGRAQQLLVDVATSRRLPSTPKSVQKQQRHSSLHATLDPDDASVSSSKIGDALCISALLLCHP